MIAQSLSITISVVSFYCHDHFESWKQLVLPCCELECSVLQVVMDSDREFAEDRVNDEQWQGEFLECRDEFEAYCHCCFKLFDSWSEGGHSDGR